MPRGNLQYVADGGRMAFRTGTGFSMKRGHGAVHTTARGELRPGAGRTLSRGVHHELHVRRISSGAVEFWQSLRNVSRETLEVTALRLFDGVLELEGAGWRMAHSELFQGERFFDNYSYFTDGLFSPVPGIEGEFGLSENFPFPAIVFTHPERGTVLMGVLSQERCKPCWTLRRSGRRMLLTAEDRFSGIPHIRVKEGQELTTERWVMLSTPGGFEDAVEAYYRLLRQRIHFVGADSILRRAVLWGSWNYNYRPRGHMDVTHGVVVSNARALSTLVPDKPRFVMIDDGYQRGSLQGSTRGWFASCLEIFHPDGQTPHDPALFPKGMKAAADAIRKAGAEPAIWTTPRIHRDSSLAAERPDLLLKVAGNRSFIGRSRYLDYSLPEAREYTRRAWHTLCHEWGYRGIKLDFWSLPFEIPEVRFANRDLTAIQLRNLFLSDLRECIPSDGYIITGCVVNNGNPFLGQYVDASRIGADIGDGAWANILPSATCLTSTVPFYRHDGLLADSDSIGWCPRSTPDENRLWATMAIMSGSMCEIGGDLTRLSPEARGLLSTVIRFFKPARRTLNGIAGCGVNNLPASHLVLERDDGVYEAYLNWMWFNRVITLAEPVRDVWTGKRMSGRCKIPPHGAVLFKRS